MKITTWNVKNFYDVGEYPEYNGRTLYITPDYTRERLAYFTKEIQKGDPDIIFLQEVLAENALVTLAEDLGYHAFKANKDHRGIANTVLYKKDLKKSIDGSMCESVLTHPVRLPSLTEEESNQPPVILRREFAKVTIPFKDKTISLIGVHLKSILPLFLEGENRQDNNLFTFAMVRSGLQKMGEVLQLRTLVNEEIKKGREVIVTGDFNESTSSALFATLKSSVHEKGELSDVMTDFVGNEATHIHRGSKLTFDTLLVTPFLRSCLKKVTILNENLKDMSELPLDNIETASDHAMVMAEFQ